MIKLKELFKKRKVLIAAAGLLIIISGTLFLTNGRNTKIPKLYIHSEMDTIEAVRCGYNWRSGTIFPEHTIVDALLPQQVDYTDENTIYISSGDQMILSNEKIKTDHEYMKNAYSIKWWYVDKGEWLLSDESNTVPENSNNIHVLAPAAAGEYICSVQIVYVQGKVEYAFSVLVNEQAKEQVLSSFKGLMLYVWKNKKITGNDDVHFTLLFGTNRLKTKREVYDLSIAKRDIRDINEMLSSFKSDSLYLAIYQMNTTDFSKEEMQKISDEIVIKGNNWSKSIGLFQEEMTDISTIIDRDLNTIMSSQKESSIALSYIEEHKAIFDEIVALGDKALEHIFRMFETGGEAGLRGAIMAEICREILKDEYIDETSFTGQGWYDNYKIHILKILDENSLDYIKEHETKGLILISMLDNLGQN